MSSLDEVFSDNGIAKPTITIFDRFTASNILMYTFGKEFGENAPISHGDLVKVAKALWDDRYSELYTQMMNIGKRIVVGAATLDYTTNSKPKAVRGIPREVYIVKLGYVLEEGKMNEYSMVGRIAPEYAADPNTSAEMLRAYRLNDKAATLVHEHLMNPKSSIKNFL